MREELWIVVCNWPIFFSLATARSGWLEWPSWPYWLLVRLQGSQLMSLVKIPTLGKDFEDQHLDPRSGTMSLTVEGFHDVTCHWQLFHDVIDTCSMMSLSLTFSVVRHFEDQNGHWHRKVHAPELPICDFISGIIEQRLSLTDSAFVLFRETCLVSLSCHFESSRKNRWLVWPLQPWQGLLSCDCNSDFTLLFWPSAGDN